jgi:hypothetical protein
VWFAPATCDQERAVKTLPAVATAAVLRKERRVSGDTGGSKLRVER